MSTLRPCHSHCSARQLSKFFKLIYRVRRKTTSSLTKWTLPGGLKRVLDSDTVHSDTGILTEQVRDHTDTNPSHTDRRNVSRNSTITFPSLDKA